MTSTLTTSLFLFLLLIALTPVAAFTQSGQDDFMRQFRWEHRVVLVFATDADSQHAQALLAAIESDGAGFSDRHMVRISVIAGEAHAGQKRLPQPTSQQLQSKYNADQAAFRVVLVGKDGGVKLDRTRATSLQDIFALIDTMPMRRQEMQQKKSG